VSSVLIVDDNEDQVWLAQHLLEREGHEVLSANDVHVAWKTLVSENPDVVLLDLHVGVEDGWGLLERLRADPRVYGKPVVVMSASREEEVLSRAHSLGAEYLDKARITSLLVERVDAALARA